MSNPKRKVTDLLPSEAILISCDEDLKVLQEFEKEGYYWEFGEKPTQWNPIQVGYALPISVYSVADKYNIISFYPSEYNLYSIQLPATDFIPTESDEVDVGDIEAELTNLKRYELNTCSGSDGVCWSEMEQSNDGDYVLWSDIEQLLKTRNTPN